MTHVTRLALIALALTVALPAAAQRRGMKAPPFMGSLYPPDLVMKHQAEIGLEPEQREAITGAIRQMQDHVLEVEWSIEAEQQKLGDLLAASEIDEQAALEQATVLMELEQQVKTANLSLLIKIRNTLSTEQRAVLDDWNRHRRQRGPRMPDRPPGVELD